MRTPINTLTLILSLLLCSAAGQDPEVVHVCKSGCAFSTIADGVEAALQMGAPVQVYNGQYDETSRIDITSQANIQFGSSIEVSLTPPGVWLNITDGATLYMNGTLLLSNGALVVGPSSALNQQGSINIDYPLLTPVIEVHGTWTQSAPVQLSSTAAADTGEALVSLGPVGTWHQDSKATLAASGGAGVRFSTSSMWSQMAECNITASALQLASVSPIPAAVDMSAGGVWHSTARTRIDATGLGVYGVYLGNANASWEISDTGTADINLTSSAPGVYVGAGSWSQLGPVSIVASTAVGVLNEGGLWSQISTVTMTLNVNVTGVSLQANGRWEQLGATMMDLMLDSTGVYIEESSWIQAGQTMITCGEGSQGVLMNSGSSWQQHAPISLTVSELGRGVALKSSSAKFTQKAGLSISAAGASTGIDFSQGGVWSQLGLTTINTTDAKATGISCGSSAACCTQINTLSSARIISSGSTAGRKDDCAAAPSPSPLASVVVAINTTAKFDANTPTVALSGTIAGSSSTATSVGVRLSLNGLTLGDTDADLAGLNVTLTVTNTTTTDPTNDNSSVTMSTFAYHTLIDDATSLVQSYTFYPQAAPLSFAGINFTVRASTVKWSLNFTTTTPPGGTGSVADAQSNGFTARYRLSGLTSAVATSSSYQVLRRSDTPQSGMTTFFVVLPPATASSNAKGVVQVEVVNVALIDDAVVPLVSVDLALANGSYALELRFPPFNQSVVYDPNVGLGVLFGRSTDNGSSSANTGLIVGVAVAVPLAVALVLVVIGAGVAVAWWRKRTLRNQTGRAIDFGGDADVDDQL